MNPQPGASPKPETSPAAGDPDARVGEVLDRFFAEGAPPPVPADFAARTARRAAAGKAPAPRYRPGWGAGTALGSALGLVTAMFALAPHTSPSLSNLSFDGELLLLLELSTLVLFSRQLLRRD